jgi:hypothetical protein
MSHADRGGSRVEGNKVVRDNDVCGDTDVGGIRGLC